MIAATVPEYDDPEYRRGHAAATRYARICALDEMARSASGLHRHGIGATRRERAMVRSALARILDRLSVAVNRAKDVGPGYHCGIAQACAVIENVLADVESRAEPV
ncbi:hypothetical protein SAMN04488581_0597 [Mycolicibacterium neoaurum]|uniref:Transposase n=2 Tax=Mycobacteriaceae TaxID=1762 RepID=A0AAV2WLM1_MYCNE|nr:hypothetical protein BN1047_03027 [Mycolicibacterium neoaurum]SDC34640.1 hypothetical protein SAMN04488581_0597 [Mycolicibacterium neoaurum]